MSINAPILAIITACVFSTACVQVEDQEAASKGQPQQLSAEQEKQLFRGMRRLLYADDSLAACARGAAGSLALLDHIDDMDPERKRTLRDFLVNLKTAMDLIDQDDLDGAEAVLSPIDESQRNRDYLLIWALLQMKKGDLHAAREAIMFPLEDPHNGELESRAELQQWALLRELGGRIDDRTEKRILGVIVEIAWDRSVIVAGFKDGSARFFVDSGQGIIGVTEDFPDEIAMSARTLVRQGSALLGDAVAERNRDWPEPGYVRMALLTPGGVRVLRATVGELEGGKHPASPLWVRANELLGRLLEFYRSTE
ncbi:MAG: hypothetical protein GY719_35165 [bacterium]|nr:hypothetical protein [bacterium]